MVSRCTPYTVLSSYQGVCNNAVPYTYTNRVYINPYTSDISITLSNDTISGYIICLHQ